VQVDPDRARPIALVLDLVMEVGEEVAADQSRPSPIAQSFHRCRGLRHCLRVYEQVEVGHGPQFGCVVQRQIEGRPLQK